MSGERDPGVVMNTLSVLAYVLAGAIGVTVTLYVLFFGALAAFPSLPDRLQVGTLLIMVGIPIPGALLGACLGIFLWTQKRSRNG